MDGMPNDLLARIFSHLPTLDLGRIMSVSRSWNTLLSTSPKLWINVDLSERPPGRSISKALQTVEAFSNRSQSTLETVVLPSPPLKDLDISKMIQLLESSRATLRKLVFRPEEYYKPMEDLMDFVGECAQLEELDLTGQNRGDKQVEPSPGTLTHFSCFDVVIVPKRHHQLLRYLKVLQVQGLGGSLLLKVLSICSGTLQYFTLTGNLMQGMQDKFRETVSNSLYHLRGLYIEGCSEFWREKWDPTALDNLEELSINAEVQAGVGPFKNLLKLHLLLPCYHEDVGGDRRLEWLQSMIDIVEPHQGTLQILSFSGWRGADIIAYSIDQFLDFLRVNIALGAPCPNLKELHLPKDFDFSATLLAEVLLSRRLLSKGYSILTPEGNEDDVHRCSELVLFLDSENQEGFKQAEREVLSRCSERMREAAGGTSLRIYSHSNLY